MNFSPISPTSERAAFVVFYPPGTLEQTIAFQLNPELINRTVSSAPSKSRSQTPPEARERISFVLYVDELLGDEFFVKNEKGVSHGVLAFLSAVELLVYPPRVRSNKSSARRGKGRSAVHSLAKRFMGDRKTGQPFVCLQLGRDRVIPVKIDSVQIIEQAFNSRLQPIRASLEIVMDVYGERESKQHAAIKTMYERYQTMKTSLASELGYS